MSYRYILCFALCFCFVELASGMKKKEISPLLEKKEDPWVRKIIDRANVNIFVEGFFNNQGKKCRLVLNKVVAPIDCIVIKKFLKRGGNVNMRGKGGNTLLMVAVYQRKPELVSLLLEYGADPSIQNEKRNSVLHIAVAGSPYDRVKEHALVGWLAGAMLLSFGGGAVGYMIGCMPLMLAGGGLGAVFMALFGICAVKPSVVDFSCALPEVVPYLEVTSSKKLSILKLLLPKCNFATIDQRNIKYHTPLVIAARCAGAKEMEELVKHGAELFDRNHNDDFTILSHAIDRLFVKTDIINYFAKKLAEIMSLSYEEERQKFKKMLEDWMQDYCCSYRLTTARGRLLKRVKKGKVFPPLD